MAVTVYVKLKLKRLNNRLNIRELNSAKVKGFKPVIAANDFLENKTI